MDLFEGYIEPAHAKRKAISLPVFGESKVSGSIFEQR
jgi:hypothetical protein